MRTFFKVFFATLLALTVFTILGTFIFIFGISSLVSSDKPAIRAGSVLVLDLSKQYFEQAAEDPLSFIQNSTMTSTPGVYDVVRMLDHAKGDSAIKGLYIKASANPNGFGTSEELREAVKNFRESGKFVIAYGESKKLLCSIGGSKDLLPSKRRVRLEGVFHEPGVL